MDSMISHLQSSWGRPLGKEVNSGLLAYALLHSHDDALSKALREFLLKYVDVEAESFNWHLCEPRVLEPIPDDLDDTALVVWALGLDPGGIRTPLCVSELPDTWWGASPATDWDPVMTANCLGAGLLPPNERTIRYIELYLRSEVESMYYTRLLSTKLHALSVVCNMMSSRDMESVLETIASEIWEVAAFEVPMVQYYDNKFMIGVRTIVTAGSAPLCMGNRFTPPENRVYWCSPAIEQALHSYPTVP